ncbi:hypothetical protein BGZ96_005230, partial [Linnemannia gamsii]
MTATEAPPQMQALRLVTDNDNDNGNDNENSSSSSEIVHIAVHPDSASGKDVILWDDIKAAFDDVIQVRSGTFIQSFLKGSDFKILEPLRIASVPGVTLDVVVRDKSRLSLESLQLALPSGEVHENTPPNYETSVATSGCNPAYGLENVLTGASNNDDNPDSEQPSRGPKTAKGDKPPTTASDNTQPTSQNAKLKTQAPQSHEEIAADAAKNVARTMMRATIGEPEALVALGDMYRDGQGVAQDFITAMYRYSSAAGQGHTRAKYSLGILEESSFNNPSSAAIWFLKAANDGFAPAQYSLGSLYLRGSGVPQDYSLAMEWFLKASDQGHIEAQYRMGYLYQQGYGVPHDYVQAMTWYLKAAEEGYAPAQANAGALYQLGEGVPQDDVFALSWFRKAADQGNADSLLYLGLA